MIFALMPHKKLHSFNRIFLKGFPIGDLSFIAYATIFSGQLRAKIISVKEFLKLFSFCLVAGKLDWFKIVGFKISSGVKPHARIISFKVSILPSLIFSRMLQGLLLLHKRAITNY